MMTWSSAVLVLFFSLAYIMSVDVFEVFTDFLGGYLPETFVIKEEDGSFFFFTLGVNLLMETSSFDYFSFVISGGIGETVCAAVAEETGITVRMLAVPRIPRSGPGDALLDLYGISAKAIVKAVKGL